MALYADLAEVYDLMYQSLFDYDKESTFYHEKLMQYDKSSVMEFGCGTGNLGSRLLSLGYKYKGVDISPEMVAIAQRVIPLDNLSVGDILDCRSDVCYDAVFFTGRSISYLTDDQQIIDAFETVALHLHKDGIFIFDPIDGVRLFNDFDTTEKRVEVGPYLRTARSRAIDEEKFIWQWSAEYFLMNENEKTLLGKDDVHLRAFDVGFLTSLLTDAGLDVLEIVPKDSYIWDDHYYVCQKK